LPLALRHIMAVLLCASVQLCAAAGASAGERLDSIRQKGFLTCGVGAGVPGFSQRAPNGQWSGFDADICKAIAAAIFGAPGKVVFQPIDTVDTFLRERNIDVVLRGLTWTSGRETQGNLRFGPVVLYDGQGFLVPKKLNITSPDGLAGRNICVSTDAGFLAGLRNYFRQHNLTLKAVVKAHRADSEAALFAGACDAMTADASELAEALIGRAKKPEDYVILPQQISKEPLAPLLRKGDDEFFDAVRWAIFALLDAEELGITSANIRTMQARDDPDGKAFFTAPMTANRALAHGWAAAAVREAGNYGEIFERNFGSQSKARLERGLNRSWAAGGLMYAPPIR
jgi:general L-amino acid transport system substrate-binding protein